MTDTFDALAYYDRDAENIPGLRQRAEREIAAELARQPKNASPSNVPPLPTLFENSPLLTQALASAESKQIAEELDRTRYNLADPSEGEEASIEDWEKALQNASSQLEHQRLRLVNLDLFNKYGANAWRISNFLTEQSTERIQREIEKVTAETEDVNRTRKVEQTEIGERLNSLETRWTQLISSNLELEIANLGLEVEIDRLRQRQGHIKARLEADAF